MDRLILQVPMSKTLKQQAEVVAADYGFSSLQEVIRVILTKLSRRELIVDITPVDYIKLSPAAKNRYAQMTEDFRRGRNIKSFDNVDVLMKHLNS